MKTQEPVVNYLLGFLEQNHILTHVLSLPPEDPEPMLDLGLRNVLLKIEGYDELIRRSLKDIRSRSLYFITDAFQCSYFAMLLPCGDEILLCGPVIFEKIPGDRLTEIMDRLHIPQELAKQLQDYYMHVPFISAQYLFLSLFTNLAEHLFGRDGYEFVHTISASLEQWKDYYTNYFRVPDEPFLSIQMIEARYETENQLIEAVESGNEDRAMEVMEQFRMHFLPARLANELRDEKDYSITLNTLLRKATEHAGVHPIHIDNLSNQNVIKIENTSSVEQCHRLQQEFVHSYCQLIQTFLFQKYSPLTQKVLNCVSANLTEDLSLKTLAEHLSVNASYLSTLFKKELGISLTEFVNRSRIRHAKTLLQETDRPIKEIAGLCGIQDISYFGHLFKRIAGTSPKAYREEMIQAASGLKL